MGIFSKKYTIATHDGKFHADDIFACATLSLVHDGNIAIMRTRDPEKIKEADYVVDVGGEYDVTRNRFDHHQKGGAGTRANNGTPYASFGLVWKTFGPKLASSENVSFLIEKKIVEPIDAWDNGVDMFTPNPNTPIPYLIQNMIFAYLPTWKENPESLNTAFLKLVGIARDLLQREIITTTDFFDGEKEIRRCFDQSSDKRVLVLDGRFPWEEITILYEEPLFVVAPRTDEKWKVEGVFKKMGSFERRIYFPESWGGKRDKELADITGVSDAIFCHNARFLVVAETKEGALKLAQLALSA